MPSKIVVAGVTSLYMAVGVDGFPLRYAPSGKPAWMRSGITGAAGHIAQTMAALGDDVQLCTIAGYDLAGHAIRAHLGDHGLLGDGVIEGAASSLGVVLVAPDGSRMGYPYLAAVNAVQYPADVFAKCAEGADLAVLTNARFVQPLIGPAQRLGLPIAVDVHLISDLVDEYNRPWLEVADIVFCSHEQLPCPSDEWVAQVFARYPGCEIAGVGRGRDGCLLGLRDGTLVEVPAVAMRGVVNTAGAGDVLFASFLHAWMATGNPVQALRSAALHASWKVGDSFPGASLLTESDLAELRAAHPVHASVQNWKQGRATVSRRRGVVPGEHGSWLNGERRAG